MTRFLQIVVLFLLASSSLYARADATCDVNGDALQQARAFLKSNLLLDGHNDVPWIIREESGGDVSKFRLDRRNEFDTDIPRLREGLVGGQFWSVWIPGETPVGDYARVQLEQIDVVQQMLKAHPDVFELALRADDIEPIFNSGKIASLIGMEGGYALNNSLGALRSFYELGVRYMTLSHNVSLDWVDAALGEQKLGGLSHFGRAVVREMNRTGMMVDLSHTSPATMHHALDESRAPVIWSHAAAKALVNHPRNVPDDVLRRLPVNGGVVMLTFVPSFLSKEVWDMEKTLWDDDVAITLTREFRDAWLAYDKEHGAKRASIEQLLDHIEHVRAVAGIDHVGIGSDYWGMPDGPVGLEDVSGFPRLFAGLICRGWNEDELKKIAGQNMLRVMREVESVAERMQKQMPPSSATIDDLDKAGR